MKLKRLFTHYPEAVAIVLGLAGLATVEFRKASRDYRYQAAQVECLGADGKAGLTQHFDSVYKDPEASGTVLVAKNQTRTSIPQSCIVALKPYAHS